MKQDIKIQKLETILLMKKIIKFTLMLGKPNPNEEGSVIAKIDLATYEVEYLDERAKRDPYAQGNDQRNHF